METDPCIFQIHAEKHTFNRYICARSIESGSKQKRITDTNFLVYFAWSWTSP